MSDGFDSFLSSLPQWYGLVDLGRLAPHVREEFTDPNTLLEVSVRVQTLQFAFPLLGFITKEQDFATSRVTVFSGINRLNAYLGLLMQRAFVIVFRIDTEDIPKLEAYRNLDQVLGSCPSAYMLSQWLMLIQTSLDILVRMGHPVKAKRVMTALQIEDTVGRKYWDAVMFVIELHDIDPNLLESFVKMVAGECEETRQRDLTVLSIVRRGTRSIPLGTSSIAAQFVIEYVQSRITFSDLEERLRWISLNLPDPNDLGHDLESAVANGVRLVKTKLGAISSATGPSSSDNLISAVPEPPAGRAMVDDRCDHSDSESVTREAITSQIAEDEVTSRIAAHEVQPQPPPAKRTRHRAWTKVVKAEIQNASSKFRRSIEDTLLFMNQTARGYDKGQLVLPLSDVHGMLSSFREYCSAVEFLECEALQDLETFPFFLSQSFRILHADGQELEARLDDPEVPYHITDRRSLIHVRPNPTSSKAHMNSNATTMDAMSSTSPTSQLPTPAPHTLHSKDTPHSAPATISTPAPKAQLPSATTTATLSAEKRSLSTTNKKQSSKVSLQTLSAQIKQKAQTPTHPFRASASGLFTHPPNKTNPK